MRGRNDGEGHGPPKMVGTARDRLEAGAGVELKSGGGGGRNIHKSNIAVTQQVLLFGAETWVLTVKMEAALDAFQGRVAIGG